MITNPTPQPDNSKQPKKAARPAKPPAVYLPVTPPDYTTNPAHLDGMDRRLRLANPPSCPSCGGFCFAIKEDLARPAVNRPVRGLKGTEVYIVLLLSFASLLAAQQRKIRKANPAMKDGLPLLYVGQSRLAPWQRLHNHFIGYKSSSWVRWFGCTLIDCSTEATAAGFFPEALRQQIAALAVRQQDDGKTREAAVAALLRSHGYPVMSH